MKKINLTRGAVAIVDDKDYEKLSKHRWYYNQGYALRAITLDSGNQAWIKMHTAIMGKIKGLEIDHINGDRLDNRKENLRHVTHLQNVQNKASDKNTSSQYKGVHWCKERKRWKSQIAIDGKHYHLGLYRNEKDAAYVYNVWAEYFFGAYARLNTVTEGI